MASDGTKPSLFQSTWVLVNGLPMHMKVATGQAPPGRLPLVLVHGLGLSHRYMMPVAECLAPAFDVFVPDLPGFGDSTHPPRLPDLPGLADALRAAGADGAGRGTVLVLAVRALAAEQPL